MIWPFKRKTELPKINANVRCEIINVSEVSIPYCENPLPYSDSPLIISKSKNGPPSGKIIEFGNIRKPYWFQFWEKKKYREDVEADKKRFHETFGGLSALTETCKYCEDGKCYIDDMTDKPNCTGKGHDLEHCGDYQAYKAEETNG